MHQLTHCTYYSRCVEVGTMSKNQVIWGILCHGKEQNYSLSSWWWWSRVAVATAVHGGSNTAQRRFSVTPEDDPWRHKWFSLPPLDVDTNLSMNRIPERTRSVSDSGLTHTCAGNPCKSFVRTGANETSLTSAEATRCEPRAELTQVPELSEKNIYKAIIAASHIFKRLSRGMRD